MGRFQSQDMTLDRLISQISSVGLNLVGVPSTMPSYAHSSTVIGFTAGSAVGLGLLAQEQLLVPIIKIQTTTAAYPIICFSDRDMNVTHLAWSAGFMLPGSVVSNASKTYYSPAGGNATVAPTHSSGSVTAGDGVQWIWIGASPMFWQARLLELPEVSQAIGGEADQSTFLLGNADRVISALAKSVRLMDAYIEYSLLHTNTGTLINIWKGRVIGRRERSRNSI
jgi:hypothetical protein